MKIRKNRILPAFSCLILLAVSGVPAFSLAGATKLISSHKDDENILCAQADDYAKAYAAGDYKTIAAMWLPEGTFTDIDGQILHGRATIEAYFKTNFEQFGGQPLKIAVDSIKFPSDNIAVEEGHTRVLQGPAMDTISRYMVVHLKTDNKWQMYAVTETTYPEAINGSLADWDWLIGNWSAKPSPSKTINITATWATGHKFIRCLFETENPVAGKQFSMVVIGRNPSSGQIISWHFDPSGGFGSGKWIKDGQTWIERASSVEADGTKGSAIYTLHKLDNNTFTWCSSQRYLGNSQLPDGEEVTITREQAANK